MMRGHLNSESLSPQTKAFDDAFLQIFRYFLDTLVSDLNIRKQHLTAVLSVLKPFLPYVKPMYTWVLASSMHSPYQGVCVFVKIHMLQRDSHIFRSHMTN